MFDICQTPTYLVFEDIFSHREIEYFSGFFSTMSNENPYQYLNFEEIFKHPGY
jgi:hypothetical protein